MRTFCSIKRRSLPSKVFFVFSADRGVVGNPRLLSFLGERKGEDGVAYLFFKGEDFELEFIF
jgi:hypothetical protein